MGKRKRIPGYRLHKPSGRAVVTLDGRDHYLGEYNTPESRAAYERLIMEYLAQMAVIAPARGQRVTIVELLVAYLPVVRTRHGEKSSQYRRIRNCLGVVRQCYGDCLVRDFRGPQLKAVRAKLAERGYNRRHLNQLTNCIKKCFRWGLSEDLAPAESVGSVLAVSGLQAGELPGVEEAEPVRPVDMATVEATLPYLHEPIATMVRVMCLTGCRPGEVVRLSANELDRRHPDLWIWRPAKHKTASRGKLRQIWLGPKAIELIKPFDKGTGLLWPSPRSEVKAYGVESFTRAIRRVILAHNLPEWFPHQIRHLVGTDIRQKYGIEAARVFLGHSNLSTTLIYAEEDLNRLADIVRRHG